MSICVCNPDTVIGEVVRWPDRDGYEIYAHIHPDDESDLGEFLYEMEGTDEEVPTQEIAQGWHSGEWRFVRLVVTACLDGQIRGSDAASGILQGVFPYRIYGRIVYSYYDATNPTGWENSRLIRWAVSQAANNPLGVSKEG